MLCAAVLVGGAVAAVYATTMPASISLVVEPLSLLLLPGLVFSILAAGAHDFAPETVIYASFVWYLVFFYLIFTWRYRRRARLIPGTEV